MANYTSKKRWYLTADRSRAVEEGDPEAAFLYATEGMELPEEEARRYGLLGGRKAAPEPVVVHSTAADPEPKAKAQAADDDAPKSRARAADDDDDAKAQARAAESKAMSQPPENKGADARSKRD